MIFRMMLGVFWIVCPTPRIFYNILSDVTERFVITIDVFVIVPLPD